MVPQPKGRVPTGKVWDGMEGEWVREEMSDESEEEEVVKPFVKKGKPAAQKVAATTPKKVTAKRKTPVKAKASPLKKKNEVSTPTRRSSRRK